MGIYGMRSLEKLSLAHVNVKFRFFLHNNNQSDLKLSIHPLRAGSALKISPGGAVSEQVLVHV